MSLLYNILIYISFLGIKLLALFDKKLDVFVKGRKHIFEDLKSNLSDKDNVIWFHSASLGEFEQGIPIIEKLKSDYPTYKILVTFFSPSGYEVRKNYPLADCVTYLPFDTKRNARKFIDSVNPKLAIFIKYEFWPNFLKLLKQHQIPTLLVSGIFRKDQLFFKGYGGFYRKALKTFDHFFVQNKVSKELLNSIGFQNVSLSGDSRFDRVYSITKQPKKLDFIDAFTKDKITLVAGSTWPDDEAILLNYINNSSSDNEKFIIAPHNIHESEIQQLIQSCNKQICRYSDPKKNNTAQVLIIDSIGLLTAIYGYASMAYVGGGFNKSGIHNILEPATYGLPIIIGPNYEKFNEAVALVNLKGCVSIKNNKSFNAIFTSLTTDLELRKQKGQITKDYIIDNIGATDIIHNFVRKLLS
ncbi:MAG: 3-deoxy-D-manno-octulosonic acid transferase [Flavobacteriales bacterium]|jgi:3-deoxy-D-manno-octulosonic-acid transferase|nr:3-deoxy-D-manno-octulosonic acid transferase [Flavobacteriales bacterium]